MLDSKLFQLRLISFLEGFSFLILLFFAMPMKYMMSEPIYVKYVGMAHGLLFIVFIYTLYNAWREYKWSFKFTFFAFLCSLIPFAPFYLERRLKLLPIK